MNISSTIHGWLGKFRQNNLDQQPAFLPLTAEEVSEVKRNAVFYTPPGEYFDPGAPTKIYGMPLHETCYAEEQRVRQLEVPFLHLEETHKPDFDVLARFCLEKYVTHIQARVCAETATLKLKFEWDCFAGLKRLLRITRWFPVQTRTALIDCRVLYPYLKVGLPHNRHYAQFKLAGIS